MLFASVNTYSDKKITVSEANTLNQLNSIIYESLIKENFIKFNRLTRKGLLVGCELEFQNTYRDTRGLKDSVMRTVFSAGSFSLSYDTDRHSFWVLLKIIPSVINIKNEVEKIYPPYLDIFINDESFEKYKLNDHECEMGGKCSFYATKKLGVDLYESILKNQPFDGEVKLSLIKDGMDTSFKLSSLITHENWLKESEKFTKCNLELGDLATNEFKQLLKKEDGINK